MFKKRSVIFLVIGIFVLFGQSVIAREKQDITDWYIQDFETNIVVNKDSSLLITENITADCRDLPNKHGIFRVLPTQIKTDGGVFKSSIELVSITDFNDKAYNYETINDNIHHTVTWKIGDADTVVSGVNNYKIIYKVKNAIRFDNKDFDEFYWNLSGNFWDIGIDNFSANIFFPTEVNSQNSEVDYYTGVVGSKDKSLATYFWDDSLNNKNVLIFNSTEAYLPPVFYPGEGITVSVTFPKDIFTPYVPTFWEKYADYFWYLFFLIPLIIFIFAFSKWIKFGKDPKMKTPIPPEFGIPENITPMQMGMVLSHGSWKQRFLTATIVDLAVRKFITIEEVKSKNFFFDGDDVVLKKNLENYDLNKMTSVEKTLLDALFKNNSSQEKDSVNLSDLENNFSSKLSKIKIMADDEIIKKDWIVKEGIKYKGLFVSLSILLIWFSFWMNIFSWTVFLSIFLSAIIFLIFGIFMPKRTQLGVDLLFKIKGFELYMRQAENYRQQFYEKENIFDKFLPYAIVFGIADLWAKKMQLIYGEDYFKNYHSAWIIGETSTNFNVDNFISKLNTISSSISSSTSSRSSSSGSHGGGSSGGGGGGGGGGGW